MNVRKLLFFNKKKILVHVYFVFFFLLKDLQLKWSSGPNKGYEQYLKKSNSVWVITIGCVPLPTARKKSLGSCITFGALFSVAQPKQISMLAHKWNDLLICSLKFLCGLFFLLFFFLYRENKKNSQRSEKNSFNKYYEF